MYKRSSNKNGFQFKEPKTKRPKLDISVCSAASKSSNSEERVQLLNPRLTASANDKFHAAGPSNDRLLQPSTSKVVPTSNDKLSAANSCNKRAEPQPPPRKNSPNNNDLLWSDADDELILIASQAVDHLDVIGQQIIVQSMSQSVAAETHKNGTENKVFKDLLQSTDEEDRLFSELQNFDNIHNVSEKMDEYLGNHQNSLINPKTPQVQEQQVGSPSVFKVPTQVFVDKRAKPVAGHKKEQNIADISFRPHNQPQSTQIPTGIEIPKPIQSSQMDSSPQGQNVQVKFLTQKQCELRSQIEYMQCENQRLSDQCQTKDGESSLLRSENERLKNLFENLRKEKSTEMNKIKIDHAVKVGDLEKEILDLKSQLQFKQMSTKQQPFRKFTCSQSSQPTGSSNFDASAQLWMKNKPLKKTYVPPPDIRPVDSRIYISSDIRSANGSSTSDLKQLDYLNNIQRLLADMTNQQSFSHNIESKMLDETLKLALLSMSEMHRSSQMVRGKTKITEFSITPNEICDLKMYPIISEKKLFRNEDGCMMRRIILCLTTICEQFSDFSAMLLLRKCDDIVVKDKNFLQLLSETLESISCFRNITNFQGFVESSCMLLTTVVANCDINHPDSMSIIAKVFHNILLCCRGIQSLETLSKFLELISYRCQSNEFFNALCSSRSVIDVVEFLATVKYSSDTCTLQIYSLLIRLTILPHEERKFSRKQLTAITKSTLLFMQNSFLKSAKWLLADSCGNCSCRGHLFATIVSLLYLCFSNWIEHPNNIDYETISKIAELGVEFVFENLVKNYEPGILNTSGTVIKNRLRIIMDWLNFYDFRFKKPHQYALQSICLQQLESMVEHMRVSRSATNNFVELSSEVYNNVVDSFFDDYE